MHTCVYMYMYVRIHVCVYVYMYNAHISIYVYMYVYLFISAGPLVGHTAARPIAVHCQLPTVSVNCLQVTSQQSADSV